MTKVFVVAGLRRSGTSLVARILQELGVFMGERLDSGKPGWNRDGLMEDLDFVEAGDRMTRGAVIKDGMIVGCDGAERSIYQWLIGKRIEEYPAWGVKNFGMLYYLPQFTAFCNGQAMLREKQAEVYLIACRRSFAKSVRSYCARSCEEHQKVVGWFAHDLFNLDMIWDRHAGPKLEVKFHRLMQAPETLTQLLAKFCGLSWKESAAALIDSTLARF